MHAPSQVCTWDDDDGYGAGRLAAQLAPLAAGAADFRGRAAGERDLLARPPAGARAARLRPAKLRSRVGRIEVDVHRHIFLCELRAAAVRIYLALLPRHGDGARPSL